EVDVIVAPMGGGGLLSGVASAVKALRPSARVYAAEPETAAPLALSRRKGQASVFEAWQSSFVDGAGGRSVLPTMWELLSELITESIVVSLNEVAAAMTLLAERLHVVAEGAAGCAVAAALSGRIERDPSDRASFPGGASGPRPLNIVAVVSGGNID